MKILIGSAWPYANGSLHIGHLAGLLPADVIARYYRACGEDVYYVSGSDCHGTPVAIRARQENKSPQEISDFYHDEFCECFAKLGFSYDRYGKTSAAEHTAFVRDFHRALYESEYIYEKETPQAFCDSCGSALADRFVVGRCPDCGESARGDQCDSCGSVLEPETLHSPCCATCGAPAVFRPTKHLFLALSRLERELTAFLNAHPYWRKNAMAFSRRYIGEGLRDRAITRDLAWGIDVPREGYEGKKIYIWAENVLGYLSMSKTVAAERGTDYRDLWNGNSRHYYVHGKDNIPFHTIILPGLLLANGGKLVGAEGEPTQESEQKTAEKENLTGPDNRQDIGRWHLPDEIIASEYLTLEGRKISTSGNWAIWVKDLVDCFHPDSIRYFLIAAGPEKRDADFTWPEFVNNHNGELLGAWGNFVNRTLVFVVKYFAGRVPARKPDAETEGRLEELYRTVGGLIADGNLKEGLERVFAFVRWGNKYFDAGKPWETRTTDRENCAAAIGQCVWLAANLAVLLEPFLPFSSAKVRGWLGIDNSWEVKTVPAGRVLPEPEILFTRLDKETVLSGWENPESRQ